MAGELNSDEALVQIISVTPCTAGTQQGPTNNPANPCILQHDVRPQTLTPREAQANARGGIGAQRSIPRLIPSR